MKPFFKLQTSDSDLNRVQDNLVRTLNPVFDNPILSSVQLTKIVLVAGKNIVDHKLGRDLVGWMVTRQRSFARLYDDQDVNPTPSKTLILYSSDPVIVDLYCF